MNVYDFDKTVYDGDSSVDFTLFCLRRRPACLLSLPRMALAAARYACRAIDKTRMKEGLFSYVRRAQVDDGLLDEFWASHIDRIKPFYLAQKRADDLVISASPEFLLRPACERLGIREPIGSRVSQATGRFDGKNCRGEEKTRRLDELFPDARIEEFYSDSLSDAPLAARAQRAWLVDGSRLEHWPTDGSRAS